MTRYKTHIFNSKDFRDKNSRMCLNINHLILFKSKMVVLMDGGTGGASNIHGRQPDPLRKRRSNERHYVFDVAFGADSTQVD